MTKQNPQNSKPNASNLEAIFNTSITEPQRLAKRIAAAGFCSRRDAEKWIADGRVSVNGNLHTSPAFNAAVDDVINVDGKTIPTPTAPRLWRCYKPRGLVVSHRDEKGRKTLFETLSSDLPRVVSVGRLDLDSEGLILLTNSGELARHLELPSTGWRRKYRARVHGRVDTKKLDSLGDGVTINGIRYRGVEATLDRQNASNAWLTIILKEGKNREIRRLMEYLGYSVSRLIRISFGPFVLGRLEEGEVDEINPTTLREQMGLTQNPPKKEASLKKENSPKKENSKKKILRDNRNANHQRQKT